MTRTTMWMLGWVATAAACSDFDLPSALSRDQILAVQSSPAVIAPGSRGRLDALVAGPDGEIADAALTWSASAGAIEVDDAGETWLVVPDAAPADGIEVALEVETAGAVLTAVKRVPIGATELDNPQMVSLEADGEPIGDAGLTAATTRELELSAQLERPDVQRLSWFATVGEIELYRHNPAVLAGPAEPARGWLFAVGRDDRGGVIWRTARVVFE